MRLGRASTYALSGLLCLAERHNGRPLCVGEIAQDSGVPIEYLRKILQVLTHAGLVRSERGRNGGFALACPASRITMRQVIEAVEGPIDGPTILEITPESRGRRLVQRRLNRWRSQAARDMRRVLDQTSLANLVRL